MPLKLTLDLESDLELQHKNIHRILSPRNMWNGDIKTIIINSGKWNITQFRAGDGHFENVCKRASIGGPWFVCDRFWKLHTHTYYHVKIQKLCTKCTIILIFGVFLPRYNNDISFKSAAILRALLSASSVWNSWRQPPSSQNIHTVMSTDCLFWRPIDESTFVCSVFCLFLALSSLLLLNLSWQDRCQDALERRKLSVTSSISSPSKKY